MPLPKARCKSELSLITDQLVQGTVIIPCTQGRKGSITLECKHPFVSRGRHSTERKTKHKVLERHQDSQSHRRECVQLPWDGEKLGWAGNSHPGSEPPSLLLYPFAFSRLFPPPCGIAAGDGDQSTGDNKDSPELHGSRTEVLDKDISVSQLQE